MTKARGDRRASNSTYCTAIDAENAAFMFRYSLESGKAKKQLDEYKTNLESLLVGTRDSSITPQEVTESSRLDEAPVKRQRQLSGKKQKSFGMSASYYLNEPDAGFYSKRKLHWRNKT